MTKVWGSGLEYVLSAAFESGVDDIQLRLSTSGVSGEGSAHRLMANLAKCGAVVTRNGDTLIVSVSAQQASECLRIDTAESVDCVICDRPKSDCACVENGGTY